MNEGRAETPIGEIIVGKAEMGDRLTQIERKIAKKVGWEKQEALRRKEEKKLAGTSDRPVSQKTLDSMLTQAEEERQRVMEAKARRKRKGRKSS